jgi:phage terminase small subunit
MNQQERIYFKELIQDREESSRAIKKKSMRGVEESVVQKYSEKAHFIYELLQNADDCNATKVHFELHRDGLRFWHNGSVHFSIISPSLENDENYTGPNGHINAIVAIGNSAKGGTQEYKIGKFGVGFKAVFQYTSTPYIYDDNFSFYIKDLIVPVMLDFDDDERELGNTLFWFPFNKEGMSEEQAYNEISEKLQNLQFPLLFLNHIEKLYWSVEGMDGEYNQSEDAFEGSDADVKKIKQVFISSVPGKSRIEKLVLFSKVEETTNLKYSVGYLVNDDEDSIVPIQVPVFCYFPTAKNSGLNFIVHAPFQLIDNREGLSDNLWNKGLIKKLAELAAESLLPLCKMSLVHDNIFDIVPYKPTYAYNFDYDFYIEFEKVLKTQPVIPSLDGGYVIAEHAYWPSSKTVTEFLPQAQLKALVNDSEASWVFVKNNYKTLAQNNKELAAYLDRIVKDEYESWQIVDGHYTRLGRNRKHRLDESAIFTMFNTTFVESQPIAWLHLFYKYLLETKSSRDEVKTKPIFLDKDRKAVAAFKYDRSSKTYEKTLFVDTLEGSTLPTLLPELLENETTKEFVKEFGIGKPNLRDEIYNDILPMYIGNQEINTSPHFRKFYEYYKTCPVNEKQTFINLIKDKEFINAIDISTGEWPTGELYRCRADEVYFPSDNLLDYFKDSEEVVCFLAEDEIEDIYNDEGKENVEKFLEELGVSRHLRKLSKGWFYCMEEEYMEELYSEHYITRNSRSIVDYYLPLLNEKIQSMTLKASVEIWDSMLSIIENDDNFPSSLKGKHGKYDPFTSSLLWTLIHKPWLYSVDGEVRMPSELLFGELDEQYNTSCSTAITLSTLLKFRTESVTVNDAVQEARKLYTEEELVRLIRDAIREKQEKIVENASLDREYDMKRESIGNTDDNESEGVQESGSAEGEGEQGVSYEYDPEKIEEELRQKMEAEKKLRGSRRELVEAINSNTRYSYEWFLNYIALMATYTEKLTSDNKANVSFTSIEAEKSSDRFFLLDGASRYIPEGISESDGATIRLWYSGEDASDNIDIEGVSRVGQKLQILTSNPMPQTIIDKLANVTRIEFQYTPVINLVSRLLNAFGNIDKPNVDGWTDIKEALPSIHYIYGPPGTGKTWNIGRTIEDITLGNRAHVLVLTPTNTAADEVCKKLIDGGKNVSAVRLSGVTDFELEEMGGFYADNLSVSELDQISVVASTIHRLPYFELADGEEMNSRKLFEYKWDYVVFDESSMIGLHYIVFAIMAIYKSNPSAKFIVAGDPMQIPPVVEINDDELENFDVQDENIYKMMGVSSFDNTQKEIRFIDSIENLDTQRRSVPEIGQLYSDLSYSSKLKHFREGGAQKELPSVFKTIMKTPVTFIDMPLVNTVDAYRIFKLHGSSYHFYSAIMVLELLKQFDIENGKEKQLEWSIGLIAPYKAQAILMDKLVSSYGFSSRLKVVSDTVHGFQGGECDIVFFVCNPNSYGMMSRNNKLKDKCLLYKQYIYNVAISRAMDYLVVLHPYSWIRNNPFINRITMSYTKHNGYSEYVPYAELEQKLFGVRDYIKDNSYVTSHDSVNVYNTILGKKYILKYGPDSLDVQVMGAKSNYTQSNEQEL